MRKEQIQTRLEATERQKSRMEKAIDGAKEDEKNLDPRIYNAMIAGYESMREELQNTAKNYRRELGLE